VAQLDDSVGALLPSLGAVRIDDMKFTSSRSPGAGRAKRSPLICLS